MIRVFRLNIILCIFSNIGVRIDTWTAFGIVKVGWKVYLKKTQQFPDIR